MSEKLIAFSWYGGKYNLLNWLLPLLPSSHHYCEPFGGSAAVLLNREPSPVETYNDIDGEVVNFFQVLRDRKEELIEKLEYTPFSRKEFAKSINKPKKDLSKLERARLFFIKARQVRFGLAQSATVGRWAYCIKTSRRNMSGAVSRWLNGIDKLDKVAERLSQVQIENDDALKVIRRYDGEETLLYCDPPYIHDKRDDQNVYENEMSKKDHKKLAETLKKCEGKVAISGFKSDFMKDLYEGWNCIEAPQKKYHTNKEKIEESLWTNYEVKK